MKTYRVAVTGGRDHEITEDEKEALAERLQKLHIDGGYRPIILHGNCRGVDETVARLAQSWGFATVPFEAPWNWTYYLDGRTFKEAGPLRNWMMIQAADLLVAFPGGRGTADCVRQAEKKGIEVVRITCRSTAPERS